MATNAPNEVAIRKYVKEMRPDLTADQVDGFFEHPGLALISALCFEAGRAFQQHNQNTPIDLPVTPYDTPNFDYKIRT